MFRFTIRDVLWLTVVVALALGWWINRRGLTAHVLEVTRQKRQYQQAFGEMLEVEYARTHDLPLPNWHQAPETNEN